MAIITCTCGNAVSQMLNFIVLFQNIREGDQISFRTYNVTQ